MHFLLQRHPRLYSLSENIENLLKSNGHTVEYYFSVDKELVEKNESNIFIFFYPEIYDYYYNTQQFDLIVTPKKYILFQIEQGLYFFDKNSFIKVLDNTQNILEISNFNLSKYSNLANGYKNVYVNTPLPLPTLNKYINIKSKAEEIYDNSEYDLIFYGYDCERRHKILNELKKKYKIYAFSGIVNNERDFNMKKGKILINLHFYSNINVLETCRFNECINCDRLIISEDSKNDQFNFNLYKDYVDFVDCINDDLSNINNLYDKIDNLLVRENYINKFITNYHKKFIIKKITDSTFINNFNIAVNNILHSSNVKNSNSNEKSK